MAWSFRLGRLFGIPVRVHFTFLLLLGAVALSELLRGGPSAALASVVWLGLVFGSVVLHEFGHALAARRFGIATYDVTLLPIGGLARLERMPEKPRQELWVALAGPAVNLGIAGLLATWLALGGPVAPAAGPFAGPLSLRLLTINVGLLLFNLLPAFPMDGGRVLRALLAERVGRGRATEIAAAVGRGMALLFGLVGLFFNPMLVFIAIFVWFGATAEAGVVSEAAAENVPRSPRVRERRAADSRPLDRRDPWWIHVDRARPGHGHS